MIRAALSDDSMKVTCSAPRDRASTPIAPDPAQTSAKRASSIRGARMLKSVSRKRSEVGRTLNPSSVFNRRPLYIPAMTRISRSGVGSGEWGVGSGKFLPSHSPLPTPYSLLFVSIRMGQAPAPGRFNYIVEFAMARVPAQIAHDLVGACDQDVRV